MAANIYRDNDKPLYKRGNRVLIGINAMVIVLFLFSKAYYVTKNKIRDKKWKAMTPDVCVFVRLVTIVLLHTDNHHRNEETTHGIQQIQRVVAWISDFLTRYRSDRKTEKK